MQKDGFSARQMRRNATLGALASLFGLGPELQERLWGGEQNPEAERIARLMEEQLGGEALAASRVRRFYREARERYMRASSQAQRIVAPPGTGHNFPYEAPEFVADLVRRVLEETAPAPAAEAPRMQASG